MVRESTAHVPHIQKPSDVIEAIIPIWGKSDREVFIVVSLDANNKAVAIEQAFMGTLASVHIGMRDIFKSAILSNAFSIIVAHNHPSGNVKPSSDDISITKRIVSGGRILNIPLLDHVIFSYNKEHCSLHEEYPEAWS